MAGHHRVAVAEAGDGALEVRADRLAEQGDVRTRRGSRTERAWAHSPPAPDRRSSPACVPRRRKTARVPRMPDQPQTADDVKALCDERDVRFIRFWFTDILGQLKSFSINVAELDDAFEGGMGFDGSSITGFNAIEESDMIAMPDAVDVRRAAVAAGPRGRRPDVLRHPHAGAHAVRGRPPPRPAPRAGAHEGDGLRHVQRRPRARVLPTSRTAAAPRRSTRAATSTSRRSTPARTSAARPCSRSSSSASTSSTPTTRSGRASTRSTCATPTR